MKSACFSKKKADNYYINTQFSHERDYQQVARNMKSSLIAQKFILHILVSYSN